MFITSYLYFPHYYLNYFFVRGVHNFFVGFIFTNYLFLILEVNFHHRKFQVETGLSQLQFQAVHFSTVILIIISTIKYTKDAELYLNL
jgi:hypothetical protein